MICYYREDVLNMLEKAIENISTFYTEKCLNYRGKCKDTKEDYEDIATAFVLNKLKQFENINLVNRQQSYKMPDHEELIPDSEKIDELKKGEIQREEEWLAKSMYDKIYENLGKIIDFQVPIKAVCDDTAGKIDLLAYAEKENVLYVLELKKSDSKETLLRCIMEIYTYYKQINGDKLLKDYSLSEDCTIVPAVLIYKETPAADKVSSSLSQKLIKALGVSVFMITEAEKGVLPTRIEKA